MKDSRKTQESRKRSLRSETLSCARRQSAALEIHGDCCSRSSAGKSTTTLSKSWHARAAASAAADSRSTTARSGRLRAERNCTNWMRNQNSGIRMKTRISRKSTAISSENRCPTRHICCCIRSTGKINKVSVKLRIQKKHVDTGMKKQLILCRKFKSNVCEG